MADDDGIDVSKLKVAELRDHLASRNLATNGLKAELAARLQEHLDSIARDNEDGADKAEPPTADGEIEQNVEAMDPASPRPAMETSDVIDARAQDGVNVQATDDKVPVEQDIDVDRVSKGDQEVVEEPEIHSAPEATEQIEDATMTEAAPAASVTGEETASKELVTSEDLSALSEGLPLEQPELVSAPQELAPAPKQDDVPETAQRLDLLQPPHPPSRALRISGLVRPIMLSGLKESLQRFGELDSDSTELPGGVWLDGIKSSGWVIFKDVSSAEVLMTECNHQPFPTSDAFRTPVSFFFVPEAILSTMVAKEEDFWAKEKVRVEIVAVAATAADTNGARLESNSDNNGDAAATAAATRYEYFVRPLRGHGLKQPKAPPPLGAGDPSLSASTPSDGRRNGPLDKQGRRNKRGKGGRDYTASNASLPPLSFPGHPLTKYHKGNRYNPYPPHASATPFDAPQSSSSSSTARISDLPPVASHYDPLPSTLPRTNRARSPGWLTSSDPPSHENHGAPSRRGPGGRAGESWTRDGDRDREYRGHFESSRNRRRSRSPPLYPDGGRSRDRDHRDWHRDAVSAAGRDGPRHEDSYRDPYRDVHRDTHRDRYNAPRHSRDDDDEVIRPSRDAAPPPPPPPPPPTPPRDWLQHNHSERRDYRRERDRDLDRNRRTEGSGSDSGSGSGTNPGTSTSSRKLHRDWHSRPGGRRWR